MTSVLFFVRKLNLLPLPKPLIMNTWASYEIQNYNEWKIDPFRVSQNERKLNTPKKILSDIEVLPDEYMVKIWVYKNYRIFQNSRKRKYVGRKR